MIVLIESEKGGRTHVYSKIDLDRHIALGWRVVVDPRGHDMYSGTENEWVEIVPEGKIHAFTVCHFGSEAFLPECPFILILVKFEDCDTLFLARLVGVDPDGANLDWIGRKVKGRFLRIPNSSRPIFISTWWIRPSLDLTPVPSLAKHPRRGQRDGQMEKLTCVTR